MSAKAKGVVMLVAAAALAGCATDTGAAGPTHLARPSGLSVAAACQYLGVYPGGRTTVAPPAAFWHVAAHMSPGSGARSFAVLARRVARDEAKPHTLVRVARMGPDFARVMNRCDAALKGAPASATPAGGTA